MRKHRGPAPQQIGGAVVKDEDLDSCPRCKEDMWTGQKLCRNCQYEEDIEDWPGGDGLEGADE